MKIYDHRIEKEILASAFIAGRADTVAQLTPEHFHDLTNRRVYEYIVQHSLTGESLSASLLVNEGIADSSYVAEMLSMYVTPALQPLLQRMDDMYYRRRVTELLQVANERMKNGESVEMVVEYFVNGIESQQTLDAEDTDIRTMADRENSSIYNEDYFIKTGIEPIDRISGGIKKNQLVVVAAQPGAGKTTLALQMAYNIGDAAFISTEMSREDIYAKLLSRLSGIDSRKIEMNRLNETERRDIGRARETVQQGPSLNVYDRPLPFYEVVRKIRREIQKGCRVVIIDYLQNITGASGSNREEQIAEMTRTFKRLAMRYHVPLVVLSQFTKSAYQDAGREPNMGDLRGSGAIAQDADIILMLWDQGGGTKLKIEKGRGLKIGIVPNIEFDKPRSRFIETIQHASMWDDTKPY